MGEPHAWSVEDQADLDSFPQEREGMRHFDLVRFEERLKELEG